MAINKVEINGEVKLDLTQDTVSEDTLLQGTTAHDAAGNPVEGKVVTTPIPVTEDVLKGDGRGGIDTMRTSPVESIDIPVGIFKGTASGSIETAIPGTDYADVFIITVGTTTDNGDGTYSFTPDKTYEEVNTAILNGKQCYVKYSDIYYPLANISERISDDGASYVSAAIFTVALKGLAMQSIIMTNGLNSDTATWVINATETAASFPSNPSNGQVLYYKTGIDRGWHATNIRPSLATDFTGIIKGANGELAQAEAGTDYMAPVAVTSADNGKFLRVVSGAWAAQQPTTEAWTFTLEDGSTITKNVCIE